MLKYVITYFLVICCSLFTFGTYRNEDSYCSEVLMLNDSSFNSGRVLQISKYLHSNAEGVGFPYQIREEWSSWVDRPLYKNVLLEADRIQKNGFPRWSSETYLAYRQSGDTESAKLMMTNRIQALVILTWAECSQNQGKYLPLINNAIIDILEQKSWVFPNHDVDYLNYRGQRYSIDLSAANYAHNLAQTVYLLNDKLPAQLRKDVVKSLRKRIFMPLLDDIKNGGEINNWLHKKSNWNAVCLAGVTGAALTVLENKYERAEFVAIAEKYSTNYLESFLEDGYCPEGLGYYIYGFRQFIVLRDCIIKATGGKVDFFKQPKLIDIAYFPYKMEIMNSIFPSISDSPQAIKPNYFITNYVNNTFGLNLDVTKSSPPAKLPLTLTYDLIDSSRPLKIIVTSSQNLRFKASSDKLRSYFEDAGLLICRPKEINSGIAVAIKGGNNAELHNHNDLGSYSIVVGNEMLMGDQGTIPYSRETFNDKRYTYKTLGSFGHPVPFVANVAQSAGPSAVAKVTRKLFTQNIDELSMDLTSAYNVKNLRRLNRTFRYSRDHDNSLHVVDEFNFVIPQNFESCIITQCKWEKVSDNEILITGKRQKLRVTVVSSTGNLTIHSELVKEGAKPYSRISFSLLQKAKDGKLSFTFKGGS